MPGTVLAVQRLAAGGLAPTYFAAASQMSIVNDGVTFLHVKNASAGSINVTLLVNANDPDAGLVIPDRVVAVAPGTDKFIGPFNSGVYNFSDGTIEADFSATASVSVAALAPS